jgi:hypothetical protein
MAIDPVGALLSAIAAPFGARLLVAWAVELRLRGILYGANLEPRRQRSDYPPPNDPIRAVLVFLLVSAIGWPFAMILATLLPPVLVDAVFLTSVIVWVGYALLRIRADDRRTLELLSARLASQVTLPHAD